MFKTYKITYKHWTDKVASEKVNASSIEMALNRFYYEHKSTPRIINIEEFTSPFYFTGVYDNGEESIEYFDDADELFYWASKIYAFDDFDDSFEIEDIVCDGVKCYYGGWAPMLTFNFFDSRNHQLVYTYQNMSWDH